MRAYDFDSPQDRRKDRARAGHADGREPRGRRPRRRPRWPPWPKGVFFTRDLVNEPANVLTTHDFAARLAAMQELGLEVEILEEARAAQAWHGGASRRGAGVGKPLQGRRDAVERRQEGRGALRADRQGCGLRHRRHLDQARRRDGRHDDGHGRRRVWSPGVMRTLALRKAKANVVGLVGLVENMPDGKAQRPGDVVASMKGDTIEVINTDAEGRLVLADVLWYAQDRFKPTGMINLATLTGAIIMALGHENTGVFSNNDDLCNAFLKAAGKAEGEGAWRMPMGEGYDAKLKSRIADMMNVRRPRWRGDHGGAVPAAFREARGAMVPPRHRRAPRF